MARAITSGELAKLRAGKQASKLYLAIHNPTVVYTARVNQATFGDPIVQITYDGGSGTLADVLPEMLMLVGSSAGAYDKGYARIRSAPSATEFYIGITSEIEFEDDDYLTVVDAMPIMPKKPALNGETLFMDYNIEYDDQNTDFNPIPIMGPNFAGFLSGGEIDYTPDASASYVIGSTITDYLWAAAGASATSNLDTATPTITYDTAGIYRVELTVTAANGKTTTAYRYIMIYDANNMPVTDFELQKCNGSFDNGGWEFSAKIYESIADILPGALAILFAKDYYNDVEESLGPISGVEHIIAVGWIDDESIEYDYELGTVDINVFGLNSRLDKIEGSPASFLEASIAGSWSEFADMTLDMVLFNLLYWRSNVIHLNDVYLTGDTRRYPSFDLSIDNIWSQLARSANDRMQAYACSDRYSRLFVEIPGQLLAVADRSTIPTIIDLADQDWTGKVNIEMARKSTSLVEVSGITDDDPDTVLMSKAPGVVPENKGGIESLSGLVFDNQAHANLLSGKILAKLNNKYPHIDIELASNNRFIDICPNQYCTLSLAAGDTPKGIAWSQQKIIPRRISFEFKDGLLLPKLECEADTIGYDGETVIPPTPIEENIDPGVDPGDFPIFPPPNIWFPPWIPLPPPANDLCLERGSGPYAIHFNKTNLYPSDNPDETVATAYYPCNIRDTGNFPTRLYISGEFRTYNGSFWEVAETNDWYQVTAIDINGNIVAYATFLGDISATEKVFGFAVGGNINVYGFRIEILVGEVTPSFSIGNLVASGSVNANDSDGVTMFASANIGGWYTVRATDGPGYLVNNNYAYYYEIDIGNGWLLCGGLQVWGGVSKWYESSGYFPYTEKILPYYERVYFQALSSTLKFKFRDEVYGDNRGTLGYLLNNALTSPSVMIENIRTSSVKNICPVL